MYRRRFSFKIEFALTVVTVSRQALKRDAMYIPHPVPPPPSWTGPCGFFLAFSFKNFATAVIERYEQSVENGTLITSNKHCISTNVLKFQKYIKL
jgi:hypothetical protein